jgi:hypothetical protein
MKEINLLKFRKMLKRVSKFIKVKLAFLFFLLFLFIIILLNDKEFKLYEGNKYYLYK